MIDLEPLLLSFEVAAIATCLATALGVAIAGIISQPRIWGRELVDAAITAPMVLPPTVLGYYLLVLLGRESALGRGFEALFGSPIVFSRGGAVIAAAIGALPLITKASRAALEGVDTRLVGAARTLGASPWRAFFSVSLPLARRGVFAGVMLGFARALGDFGVTLMVAGNIPGRTRTASLAIYDAVLSGRDADATRLSLIITGLAMVVLISAGYLTRHGHDGF
ncbi:MAG TPA: molybdate ABC transporter permease subunit [Polyangiaceae bacterium]|nr:molybdate ABC transporter permease subunit [Polyangiaceae bacterium]